MANNEFEFGLQTNEISTASGKFYYCHATRGICTVEEMSMRQSYQLRVLLKPLERKRLHVKDFRRLDFKEFEKLGFKVAFVFETRVGSETVNVGLGQQLENLRSVGVNTTLCHLCGEVFDSQEELFDHKVGKCFLDKNCPVCGFVAKTVQSAKVHMRQHTGETPFECLECGQTFRLYGALTGHIRQQHPDKDVKCIVNGTEIEKKLSAIECSVCQKRFDTTSRLERHAVIHTGEKPFSCDVCERGFTQKADMHKHRRTHTGEKPYHCPECEKQFSCSGDLTKHTRIVHTKILTPSLIKRIPCPDCDEKFRSNFDMEIHHKRRHLISSEIPIKVRATPDRGTPSGPPKCQYCDEMFENKYETKQHEIIVHTKKYPYSCEKCSFKCIKFSEFQIHQKVHAFVDPKLRRKAPKRKIETEEETLKNLEEKVGEA